MSRRSFYELDSRSKAQRLNWIEDERLRLTLADLERCRHTVEMSSDHEQRRIERRFDRMLTATRRRQAPLATMTSPPVTSESKQSTATRINSATVRSASAGMVRSTMTACFAKENGRTNLVFKSFDRGVEAVSRGPKDGCSLAARMAPPAVGFRNASRTRQCRSCLPREMSSDDESVDEDCQCTWTKETSPVYVRHQRGRSSVDIIFPLPAVGCVTNGYRAPPASPVDFNPPSSVQMPPESPSPESQTFKRPSRAACSVLVVGKNPETDDSRVITSRLGIMGAKTVPSETHVSFRL